jgi:hypothetical protein
VPPDPATGNRRRSDDAEMFLNSRGGRIHLFPVKSQADEVAFHNFQARGGFLISACKNAGGVYYVVIQARRDSECRLLNPWPGRQIILRETGKSEPVPFQLDQNHGESIVFSALAGHQYLIDLQTAV